MAIIPSHVFKVSATSVIQLVKMVAALMLSQSEYKLLGPSLESLSQYSQTVELALALEAMLITLVFVVSCFMVVLPGH